MNAFLFTVLALVASAYAGNQYGTPAEQLYTPQVFRHVFVHSAEDYPVETQSRVIRVPGGDKHVNIIFVRTPSYSSRHETEVILPEQDEHKNLVYVLLKKGENTNEVKVRQPAPRSQQKPEVYFIRYNNGQGGGAGGIQSGSSIGGSGGAIPSSQYGAF